MAKTPGQEAAHGVLEAQTALCDELHGNRRHEALRHAPDPEPVVRASLSANGEVRMARRDDRGLAVFFDEGDHGGNRARGDQPVGLTLQFALGRARGAPEEGACETEECEQPHMPYTRRARSPLQRYVRPARRV
jgi:hypothetical protein